MTRIAESEEDKSMFSARTDIGCVRKVNQDCFGQCRAQRGGVEFFIIADGMGGHNAGEVASSLTVSVCMERAALYDGDCSVKSLQEFLKDAVQAANREVLLSVLNDESKSGMGTTAVFCAVTSDSVIVANIGDSRAYVISSQTQDVNAKQLTVDHSAVELLVQTGYIERASAMSHPWRNILIRAVGADEFAQVDVFAYDYNDKDILIMCSDGLTSMVDDESILKIVRDTSDAVDICDSLIMCAKENGGEDNITVIVVNLCK